MSIPHGVVSLSERYGEEAICLQESYEETEDMEERLRVFCRRHQIGDAVRNDEVQKRRFRDSDDVGKFTPTFPDMTVPLWTATLDFDEAMQVSERIRRMACEERAAHPCIGRSGQNSSLPVARCWRQSCAVGPSVASGWRTACAKEFVERCRRRRRATAANRPALREDTAAQTRGCQAAGQDARGRPTSSTLMQRQLNDPCSRGETDWLSEPCCC